MPILEAFMKFDQLVSSIDQFNAIAISVISFIVLSLRSFAYLPRFVEGSSYRYSFANGFGELTIVVETGLSAFLR